MKSKHTLWIVSMLLVITSLLVISCQSSKETPKAANAVCIWDKTALRAEPSDNGKWMASLQLGEIVNWSGKTVMDSTSNREYMEITLSDGKTGWAKSDLLVPNARLGAIKESTPIYRRPDLLTLSDKNFEMMDMVAVTDTSDLWSQVVGKEKRKKGWIMTDAIIFDKNEVTVAILAKKALDEAGNAPLSEILPGLQENLPFPNSYFLKKLQEQVSKESNIIENDMGF